MKAEKNINETELRNHRCKVEGKLFAKIIILAMCSFLSFYSFHSETAKAEDNKTIVFATTGRDDRTLENHYKKVYTDAFRRLGYQFKLVRRPGKRAVYDANAGVVDGDAGRIKNLQKYGTYPNLVRVDTIIASLPIVAYGIKPNIQINGWESLKNSGYKVVYVRGIRITEINLPEVLPKENIMEVTTPSQAFGMILAGRADMIIWSENTLHKIGQSEEYRDYQFHRVGFLQDMVLFPYLHKKHADMVPLLNNTLRQMKEEGVFQPLIQNY